MKNYAGQFALMTWSYSRLTQFENCKYAWKIKYLDGLEGRPLFFAQYGSFMHSMLEKYLSGELRRSELEHYYLTNFLNQVDQPAPNSKTFHTYFQQGLQYWQCAQLFPWSNTVAVEKQLTFKIGADYFTGIVDAVDKTGNSITVIDHKSRTLKPLSGRKKLTQSDRELLSFARQLYLYSVPIAEEYGVMPEFLAFNTFRTQQQIILPFDQQQYDSTLMWATNTIQTIKNNTDWSPSIEWFQCSYLCDVKEHCEYYHLLKHGALVKG